MQINKERAGSQVFASLCRRARASMAWRAVTRGTPDRPRSQSVPSPIPLRQMSLLSQRQAFPGHASFALSADDAQRLLTRLPGASRAELAAAVVAGGPEGKGGVQLEHARGEPLPGDSWPLVTRDGKHAFDDKLSRAVRFSPLPDREAVEAHDLGSLAEPEIEALAELIQRFPEVYTLGGRVRLQAPNCVDFAVDVLRALITKQDNDARITQALEGITTPGELLQFTQRFVTRGADGSLKFRDPFGDAIA